MNKLLSIRLSIGDGIYASLPCSKEWEEKLEEYFLFNLSDPFSLLLLKCEGREISVKGKLFKKDLYSLWVVYSSKDKSGNRDSHGHVFIFDGPMMISQASMEQPETAVRKIHKDLIDNFNLSKGIQKSLEVNALKSEPVTVQTIADLYAKRNSGIF